MISYLFYSQIFICLLFRLSLQLQKKDLPYRRCFVIENHQNSNWTLIKFISSLNFLLSQSYFLTEKKLENKQIRGAIFFLKCHENSAKSDEREIKVPNNNFNFSHLIINKIFNYTTKLRSCSVNYIKIIISAQKLQKHFFCFFRGSFSTKTEKLELCIYIYIIEL